MGREFTLYYKLVFQKIKEGMNDYWRLCVDVCLMWAVVASHSCVFMRTSGVESLVDI